MIELDDAAARALRDAHHARVDALIAPHVARRGRGLVHPVDDFLFTYYSYRPAALRRWHLGVWRRVHGAEAAGFAGRRGYLVDGDTARIDPGYAAERRRQVRWIRRLLAATAARPAQLGCFGLHEWAMVYRQSPDELRHAAYPLRLSPADTDAVVESHRITCTHFDAFRFFTAPARPLNVVQPTRDTQPGLEQPGCLHATMDLYKWAHKLAPLVPSELIADCFELALDVRRVDMAAAPYDLGGLGVEPIAIETAAGKAAYLEAQASFAERSRPLRQRLVDICDRADADADAVAQESVSR